MFAFIIALQSPKIDPGAMGLLKKNRDAMFALRGYRAQCQMVIKSLKPDQASGQVPLSYQFSVLTASKPNLMRYQMWETISAKPPTPPDFAIVSNGKKRWTQSHTNYSVGEPSGPNVFETAMEPWDGFYISDKTYFVQVQSHLQKKDEVAVRRLGREKVDGILCNKIEIDVKQPSRETQDTVLLRPDGLVRRQIEKTNNHGSVFIITSNLLHIEKNPDLRRQSYAYTPPKGATAFKAPEGGPEATSHDTLLANGTLAPDFVAKDKNGKEIRLSDLKGKVVILDFWASWCAPCVASMPHTQRVVSKLLKDGLPVVVLAVDDAETVDAFNAWVKKTGINYPALNFLYSPKEASLSGKTFKVTGIPTQYIVDATGTIRASFIGYDGGESGALEEAVRAALTSG